MQQIEQPQQTDLNVLTKVEPKTSEPSPIQQQQQQQYYQPQQYDAPDLSYDINKLNLQANNSNTEFQFHSDRQESLPFNPQIPEQQTNPQYNYNPINQYQEQPAQLNNRRNEIDSQNLTFEPVNQQRQQQVPFFNPQELNSTQISNQSPSYDTKQTTFNFNPPVDSNTNNQPRRPSTVNSNHGFQSNRSRQSSTSTSYEPPFNPFQQQSIKQSNSVLNQQQQPFFDPNTAQMTRSATYPTNETPIKEETTKTESVDHDDEDDFKKDKNKEKSQQKGNEWWFKRAIIDKIMPPNTAKRMVLPDDKKKTVIF